MRYRPRKVTVGTDVYRVFWYKEEEHDVRHKAFTDTARKVIGVYDYNGIEVDLLNSFLHECLHAIYYDRFGGADVNGEEPIVVGVTNGLLLLLKDNPRLLEWMQSTLRPGKEKKRMVI